MSSRLRAIARDTVEISERGSYSTGSREVPIAVTSAVAGTTLYLPGDELSLPPQGDLPQVDVTNESTLEAARRLGGDIAALVFASARNPGGGFLNGAHAQEESVARASALYPCLLAAGDFYRHHRAHEDLTEIQSAQAPAFRPGVADPCLSGPFCGPSCRAALVLHVLLDDR